MTSGVSTAEVLGEKRSLQIDYLLAPPLAAWLIAIALAVATIRAIIYSLGWPLLQDAPLMHYIALRMLHGAVPYRDVLDMNMPGTYWIHEAVVATLGTGDKAWRFFDLGCLAAICMAAAGILRRAGGAACALGVVLLAAWHLDAGPMNVGQRDFMAVLPLVLAALACIRFTETSRRRELIVAGLAVGLATLIKPTAILVPAFLLPSLIASGRREPRAVLVDAVSLGLPIIAVLAAAAVVLAAEGALVPFVAGWREFILPVYSRLHDPSPTLLASAGQISVRLVPCLLLVGVSWGLARCSISLPLHFILGSLAVWGFLSFLMQDKGWFYHSYPWAMFTIMLAAVALGDLMRSRRVIAAYAATLLVFIVPATVIHHGGLMEAGSQTGYVAFGRFIARDLARFVKPGDLVQTMDTTDGAIDALLILGLKQPTPFIYDWMLVGGDDTPFRREARAEFLADMMATPPKAIVITNQQWPEPAHGYRRVGSWREFNTFLTQSYTLQAVMRETPKTAHSRGYLIYVRKS